MIRASRSGRLTLAEPWSTSPSSKSNSTSIKPSPCWCQWETLMGLLRWNTAAGSTHKQIWSTPPEAKRCSLQKRMCEVSALCCCLNLNKQFRSSPRWMLFLRLSGGRWLEWRVEMRLLGRTATMYETTLSINLLVNIINMGGFSLNVVFFLNVYFEYEWILEFREGLILSSRKLSFTSQKGRLLMLQQLFYSF